MIERLPRPAAALLAVLILVLSAWCLTTTPPPVKLAPKGGYTDVMLYKDITKAVAAGKPYHQAAAELHRAHYYPLKPFFTMRLPTLSVLAADLGWAGLQKVAFALVTLAVFLWVIAPPAPIGTAERVFAGIGVAAGGSVVTQITLLALHEFWAGILLGLALALQIGWRRQWWLALIPAAAALAVRELALPFVLLSLAFALWERRWREALAWTGLIAAFALLMAWHAQHVLPQVRPGDLHSQGWNAMQGLSGFLKAVIYTSGLQQLPLRWGLLGAFLPMIGWGALGGRAGAFSLLMFLGYAAMIAMFSRPDTFYWGGIVLPAYFVGYALLPRALAQLAGALRARG
jgi:hypothetical protein